MSSQVICCPEAAVAPMATTVVNLRYSDYDVYIGRKGKGKDGYFGNPHDCDRVCRRCGKYHDRAESIELFKEYFYARIKTEPEFKRRVLALRGKRLGCFCAPLPCHGQVIAAFVDGQ